jgi:hypothetical protein
VAKAKVMGMLLRRLAESADVIPKRKTTRDGDPRLRL